MSEFKLTKKQLDYIEQNEEILKEVLKQRKLLEGLKQKPAVPIGIYKNQTLEYKRRKNKAKEEEVEIANIKDILSKIDNDYFETE